MVESLASDSDLFVVAVSGSNGIVVPILFMTGFRWDEFYSVLDRQHTKLRM